MCEPSDTNTVEVKLVDDFIDVKQALMDHYKEQSLKILVCGKTGVGKSTLLNTLLGRELLKTGGPGSIGEFTFKAVADNVIPVCTTIQNVLFEVYDSPGLQDGTENDEKYLECMHKACADVDLVLYCIDMTTARWTHQEIMATLLLTKKFGVEFWKKAILVLTKANTLKPKSAGVDEATYFKRAYDSFIRKFQTQLVQQEVPEDITSKIPTVAAGSNRDRYLPYVSKAVSDGTEERCRDFLAEIWLTCFEQMSQKSRFNFLKVTDYSKRIEVNREHLQPYQKAYIDDLERQFKIKEKELQDNVQKLNQRISQLNADKQREIERVCQSVQSQYAQSNARTIQQPQIVYRTEYRRSSSDDGCFIL